MIGTAKKVKSRWDGFSLMLLLSLVMAACANRSPTLAEEQNSTLTETPAVIVTVTERLPVAKIPADEIDSRMSNLVEQIPLAGMAVGIQFQDEFYEQGYGLADISSRTPVVVNTVFKIASLTKAVTAAAILHLSEQGKLSLDDPISRYIPETPEIAQNIQVRHLLNHTSGLPDWSIDVAQEALPETFTTAQAVDYYFSTFEELDSEPGQVWSYGNIGYFLLGAIIENVSGMTYNEYLREKFFEPLGIDTIGECPSQAELTATGHHMMDKQIKIADPSNLKLGGAAAALCSTAGDLLRWQVALTEGKVIRPESWDQMITPGKLSNGQSLDYGFGLSVQQSDYGAVFMHEGATAGFNSFFIYYPEQDLNIVLLSNTDGFDPTLRYIAVMIAEILLPPQ